jgi:predicted glutamine amidotransferase
MCRLFAWQADVPTSLAQALGSDGHSLVELSKFHRDGWGVAWYEEGRLHRHRDEHQLSGESALETATTRAGIAHLRWATASIPVCDVNTHPFVMDGPWGSVAFAHNGSLPVDTYLTDLIQPTFASQIHGTGDSEHYFAAIMSLAVKFEGDYAAAYREFFTAVEHADYGSLNTLMLTPDEVIVVAAHRPEKVPADFAPNYYELSWDIKDGVTSAWSSGVRERAGTRLENFTMLRINQATGATSLTPLR